MNKQPKKKKIMVRIPVPKKPPKVEKSKKSYSRKKQKEEVKKLLGHPGKIEEE